MGRLMTSEMVGARVIVAASGTEKCKGRDKGLKGIVTAVSKQSYYITYQKRVIDTSSSSSSPVSSSAVLQTPAPDTATQSDLCAASTSDFQEIIVQSNPEEVCNDNSKSAGAANREWKEVVWTDKMVVRRLLKSTCILAVLLPPPVKKARKSMDGISINSSEGESGRICLLHGRELMQYSIPP